VAASLGISNGVQYRYHCVGTFGVLLKLAGLTRVYPGKGASVLKDVARGTQWFQSSLWVVVEQRRERRERYVLFWREAA
jgi:hypothetical protein